MKYTTLKPNGVSHTAYPDQPAQELSAAGVVLLVKEKRQKAQEFLPRKHSKKEMRGI